MIELSSNETFGLLKSSIDVHTLGIITVANLLKDCGYHTVLSGQKESDAVIYLQKVNNITIINQWISSNHITRLGFSYRLDPKEGKDYFCKLYHLLRDYNMFSDQGGCLKTLYFAGLPDTCRLIKKELGKDFLTFGGDETPVETLRMLGIPEGKLPKSLVQGDEYDKNRWEFARRLIESEEYKNDKIPDHYGYPTCGTFKDTFIDRLEYCKNRHSLPIIRVHAGPYNPNRLEGVKEFISWTKKLAKSRLLDVLSIGSSQLTQSNFGENWEGLPNGGGVPVNSEIEYTQIREAAYPMLVRTYAGTKDVPGLAIMHERSLNISWHALSFWWFCEIDGRGKNTVSENLKEHFETIKYIATTGKPLEPNVPHHFSFRGGDDITYIISAYLAAKAAKKAGIKHLILQNMLNTPKYTWGYQDVAKGRVMLKLVRELEDDNFKISLQTRAGLDYLSPDLEKAKIQLAAVTALMDDIEPENDNSPEIIHVVSYSEAVRLATPDVIKESIQITLTALQKYRKLRKLGLMEDMRYNANVQDRVNDMYDEAKEAIRLLEDHISNLYSAEGLYRVFKEGFFPVPYMLDLERKYFKATNYITALKDGGVRVVDKEGKIIRTTDRYKKIIDQNS